MKARDASSCKPSTRASDSSGRDTVFEGSGQISQQIIRDGTSAAPGRRPPSGRRSISIGRPATPLPKRGLRPSRKHVIFRVLPVVRGHAAQIGERTMASLSATRFEACARYQAARGFVDDRLGP